MGHRVDGVPLVCDSDVSCFVEHVGAVSAVLCTVHPLFHSPLPETRARSVRGRAFLASLRHDEMISTVHIRLTNPDLDILVSVS